MSSPRHLVAASTALVIALGTTIALAGAKPAVTAVRHYGTSHALGQGTARSYVLVDRKTGETQEIGIALSERALEGLPADGAGHHGQHGRVHQYLFDLPVQQTAPFRFVELNWNPHGHEPDGVYEGKPHFDFHFYTITRAERDAIVPRNPNYATQANLLPAAEYVPPFTVQLGPQGATPADVAVPLMGVHWVDPRSPELQALLGKPEAYRPFTTTFIHGSWNGRFIFWEPMITRAHIMAKRTATDPAVRDEVIPIEVSKRYAAPGMYPTAYRITWDAEAREYRIALTGLVRRGAA